MAEVDVQLSEDLRLAQTEEPVLGSPVSAIEALRISEALITYYGALVIERPRIADRLAAQMTANVLLGDTLRIVERLYSAREAIATDTLTLHQTDALQAAILIIEKLRIGERLQGGGRYQLTLTQALRLTVTLTNFFGADVLEALALDDDLFTRLLAHVAAADAVGIEAEVQPQLLVAAHLDEGIDVTAEMAIAMLFNPTVIDGVEITAGMLEPNGSFTTWVMNTRTGGVTEYDNYAFNSFAQMGGRYVAASDDGLYELLGDTDADAEIIARVKGGFLQFGGTKLSRLKDAYIAVRGQGRFVLRVRTADGAVYNYGVDTRDGRSTKVHMGKGQRSRYFAWELITAGQDFDLDTLEFVPIVVSRRV